MDRPSLDEDVVKKEHTSSERPPIYKLLLHNDDFNRREYVVQMLMKTVEGISVDDAVNIMQASSFNTSFSSPNNGKFGCAQILFQEKETPSSHRCMLHLSHTLTPVHRRRTRPGWRSSPCVLRRRPRTTASRSGGRDSSPRSSPTASPGLATPATTRTPSPLSVPRRCSLSLFFLFLRSGLFSLRFSRVERPKCYSSYPTVRMFFHLTLHNVFSPDLSAFSASSTSRTRVLLFPVFSMIQILPFLPSLNAR